MITLDHLLSLFPVYRFNAPIPYGDTGRGYKKEVASANVAPGLDLMSVDYNSVLVEELKSALP